MENVWVKCCFFSAYLFFFFIILINISEVLYTDPHVTDQLVCPRVILLWIPWDCAVLGEEVGQSAGSRGGLRLLLPDVPSLPSPSLDTGGVGGWTACAGSVANATKASGTHRRTEGRAACVWRLPNKSCLKLLFHKPGLMLEPAVRSRFSAGWCFTSCNLDKRP